MSKAEIVFPSALFVVVAALLTGGWIAGYSWIALAFPLGAGAIMCALCAYQIALVFAGHVPPPQVDGEAPEPLTVASIVWIGALGVLVYALGFVIGPAVYLLAYLRANGFSWYVSITTAAASIIVTWGVFIRFLQVPLPLEPLWMG